MRPLFKTSQYEAANTMNETEHEHAKADSDHHEVAVKHPHSHGVIDPILATTERGIWAVKWSFIGLSVTAIIQVFIVLSTGSIALLADTIHNFGDATTAIPLWIAFKLARRKPSARFSYGFGRVEDLAGLIIIQLILFSAVVSAYESVDRFLNPRAVENLWAVAVAAILGFAGNEAVAVFRIRVGREINSAALISDGYHARVDGLSSLAVLVSVLGIWLGFPLADPIVGILITLLILRIVWTSGKPVLTRLLDGTDPEIKDEIRHAVAHARGVREVTEVRVRWLGHRLHAEINLAVAPEQTVGESHAIAIEAKTRILQHLPHLSNAIIHVDPENASGEEHHLVPEHSHDHSSH
jgi:cation diffusion facilitator family transporter